MNIIQIPVEIRYPYDIDISISYSDMGSNHQEILSSLRSITSYELETYRLISYIRRRGIRDRESILNNHILYTYLSSIHVDMTNENILRTIRDIPYDLLDGYTTVAGNDKVLTHISEDYPSLNVYILKDNHRYIGHIYGWRRGDILNLQGIRSSLLNTLLKHVGLGVGGIGYTLVSHIISTYGDEYSHVQVDLPLEGMISTLERLGFKDNDDDMYIRKL